MYGAMHSVYLTAHGEHTSSTWQGETAQIGLRLPFAPKVGGPAKGGIWTPINNGDVVQETGTQAGTHGTLAKTWTARVGPIGSTDNADSDFQINLAEHFWTFLDGVKGYIGNGFRWTHVKVAPIGVGGDYEAAAATYSFSSPLAGTGTSHLPPQIALACSLRAPIIGKRGRGRFYLPCITTSQCGTYGDAVSTMRTVTAGKMKDLIDDIQGEFATGDYQPIVSVFTPGALDVIRPSEVRIGDRFDTQQRRREQVPESYIVSAL